MKYVFIENGETVMSCYSVPGPLSIEKGHHIRVQTEDETKTYKIKDIIWNMNFEAKEKGFNFEEYTSTIFHVEEVQAAQ